MQSQDTDSPLKDDWTAFSLHLPSEMRSSARSSGLQILKDGSLSLYKAGLCPAAKIYFSSDLDMKSILRPEVEAERSYVPEDNERRPEDVKSNGVPAEVSLPIQLNRHRNNREDRSASGRKVPKWLKPK